MNSPCGGLHFWRAAVDEEHGTYDVWRAPRCGGEDNLVVARVKLWLREAERTVELVLLHDKAEIVYLPRSRCCDT